MLQCSECRKRPGESAIDSSERFSSLNDLEAHLVEEHFSNCCIYECPICQYTRFPTEFSLVQHCREFHKDLGKIQFKQSVDSAKLDSRSLIHSSLNSSVFELANEPQVNPPKASTEILEKVTPSITNSISQKCTIFHAITPGPSTSKKSFAAKESIELEEIPHFTTRTSQQGGTILISPTGYEYRKSKKDANNRGEYTYRCNTMLGYRDCRARVAVEICTGVGTLKDQQHNHPPPAEFHQKLITSPQAVAKMFLTGGKSKRRRNKISNSQSVSNDCYEQEGFSNFQNESLEPLAKREDIEDEDHPSISSLNDFIYCMAQQK